MYGHVRLNDKLKTLYLHFHNTYCQKTYQRVGIPQGAPSCKCTWPLNEMVYEVFQQIKYIISPHAENQLTPKLLTFREILSPLKPYDPLITLQTWDHIKIPNHQGYYTRQGADLLKKIQQAITYVVATIYCLCM